MTISVGLYNRNIPVVNIQDIRFDVDVQGDYKITLGISNEQTKLLKKKNQKFNNFVYFANNQAEVDLLASNPTALKEVIDKNPSGGFAFAPSYKDFDVKTRTEQSKEVYSYFYQKDFTMKASENLYVLVCSFIEKNRVIRLGNIVKETLVRKNQTPVNAKLYTLAQTTLPFGTQGTVWPGSAHIQNNNVMVGNSHMSAPHPNLTPVQVPNIRLKDLRVIAAINSLDFSFSKMPESYFSPVTLSRGKAGNINGAFTFNLLNFSKNDTKFGGLIKNETSLLSSVRVKDIVLYHKITGHEASGNALTPGNSTLCGLKESGRFKTVANLNDGCSITSNVVEGDRLLQAFFLDKTVSGLNSGVAEYKTEITFEDNTPELLRRTLAPLRSNLKKIVDLKDIPDDPAVFNEIIVDFLTSVQTIFGLDPFRTFTRQFWEKNLLALVNKFNPNYDEDKQLFLRTMRDYVARLEKLLAPSKKQSSSFDVKSRIYNSNYDPTLRARRTFLDNYTFTGTRAFGLNYVDNNLAVQDVVLPSISFGDFSTRAKKEVSKYQIINTQAAALNPYGYLSAESVNLTPNPLEIDTSQPGLQTVNALPLIKSRIDRDKVFTTNKKQKASSATNDILRGLNISAKRSKTSLRKLVRSKTMVQPTIDSEEYFSATSNFLYENKPSSPSSGSVESSVTSMPAVNILGSTLVGTIVESSVTAFAPATTITNQAQLLGSPALQKLNEDSSAIQNGSAFSNAINFNSVAQVQYLDSYDVNEGVAKQNWKLLTEQQFNNAIEQQKPLMCKLVKVSNALGVADILDMEPMSSMFIIGSPATLNTAQPRPLGISAIKNSVLEDFPSIDLNDVEILYSKNIPFVRQRSQRATGQQPISSANLFSSATTNTNVSY